MKVINSTEQSLLSSNHCTPKKITAYDVRNTGPGLEQAQKRGIVKSICFCLFFRYDHGHEFSFQLGIGQVIQGWEKGLLDMCVGEKRKLTVPPHLAYGTIGAGIKMC